MASDKALRTRQSIIEAANALVASEGISALTMDNVAKKAGLSKGACTYHFKSKRELQTALLENYVYHLDEQLNKHEELFEGEPSDTLLSGYIQWFRSFDLDNHGWAAVGTSLLSEYCKDEELMKPVKEWYQKLFERIEQAPKEKQTALLIGIMALEGFFYTHKFGVDLVSPKMKREAWNFMVTSLMPSRVKTKKSAAK